MTNIDRVVTLVSRDLSMIRCIENLDEAAFWKAKSILKRTVDLFVCQYHISQVLYDLRDLLPFLIFSYVHQETTTVVVRF